MFQLGPAALGVTIIIIALALVGMAILLTRVVPRIQPANKFPVPPSIPLDLPSSNDAVLVVQPGGRVLYSNQQAREWFGYYEEEPNLERLARRTRPSEVFLGLCATEGQVRFSIDGRMVEGTSYSIPYDGQTGTGSAILVSLRRPQVTTITSGEAEVSKQALDTFNELSRAMAASLELDKTLQAILEGVERLIPSDFSEITIWDNVNQYLTPYRFVGLQGVDRHLEEAPDRYLPGQGYSGYLITQRTPLLIDDVDTYREVRPIIDRKKYPFNSYLGVPLLVAGELTGTLELASLSKNAFNKDDQEVLRILSDQAAIAVHNALLYQEQRVRVRELSGLARLAHAVAALRDTQDLFGRLVESITPLLDVACLGFLIYDESRRTLETQSPFIGIPDQFMAVYRLNIPPNSPAEGIWLAQKTIISSNAPEDERLAALGLDNLARAAGVVNTVLVPLTSVGRSLGYLQVADKRDGTPFNQSDLRLLEIIAGQAATIIENAMLVKETQERALRAESLHRIASLTGSLATLGEILEFSLRELARLLHADIGAIYLLDETRGELTLHKESFFGVAPDKITRLSRILMSDPQYHSTVTSSKKPYLTGNILEDIQESSIYYPWLETLKLQSMIDVPLILRDLGVGEIILGSKTPNFFDQSDLILLSTTASQLAGALEKSELYAQTDESLRRRVEQLTALTHISRELNATLDLQHLLKVMYNEIVRTTQADCGTIMLFDLSEQFTERFTERLSERISVLPRVILSVGDPSGEELSPLERTVFDQGEPIIVEDYKQQGQTFQPPHEEIRSSLVVPITYQEHAAGLIHLHAKSPGRLDNTSYEIAQSLAIQAAIALGNTLRYQEQLQRGELLNRQTEMVSKFIEVAQFLHPDQSLEQSLEALAYGIHESTPFKSVVVSVFDLRSGNMNRVAGAGLSLEMMNELRNRPQPWGGILPQLKPEYRFGRSYLLPHQQSLSNPPDLHLAEVLPLTRLNVNGKYAWDPQDMLIIPLINPANQPVGMISLDAPRNGLRPDKLTYETLEIFASQAILIIENHQKLDELNTRAAVAQKDIKRAQKELQTAQSHLPTLLHKDVEQTLAIHQLSQRARRIQAGLDIVEIVNRQPNRASALLALGQEILTRMDMDITLVAEPSSGGPRLLYALGSIPMNANPEALLGQRNPLRLSLQNGETIIAPNLEDNPEWLNSPLLEALEAKGFISLSIPRESAQLVLEEEGSGVDAAVLAISRSPLASITSEDEQLFGLMTRQVAITLENLHLLTETNLRLMEVNLLLEFSRQLGSLDPISILQTLVNSALQFIPVAHAGMVALWKPEQGCLVPQVAAGYIDNNRILEIHYRSGEALPGKTFELGKPLRIGEVDFAQHYDLPPENLVRYRNASEGRLPISTLIVPIQTLEDKLGVLVLDNFQTPNAFTDDDQALISTLAQQTALALENARLYQASEQRAHQLQALTDVAATITSRLQTDELIASLLDQVKTILTYDTGTLWLRQVDRLTIRAARGFEDSEERLGLSVALEDSLLLKEMIQTSQPIAVGDVRDDQRFQALIEPRFLSWLGVPLLSKGEVVGVIALEKTEPNYYTVENVQAVITFAGQAAVALENANLFEESVHRTQELDQRSQRLALLNRLSSELSGSLDLDYILNLVNQELIQAIDCSAVSAVLFDSYGKAILHAESPLTTPYLPMALPDAPLFGRLRESLGIFSTEDVSQEEILTPLMEYLKTRKTHALLALPLVSGNDLQGLLLVQADRPYRFSADEVELARTISNQVAVAIQNARLFAETRRLFAETQQRSAELATLFELGVSVSQVLDQRRLVDITFDTLLHLLPADSVTLVILNETTTMMVEGIDCGARIGPLTVPRTGHSFSEHVSVIGQPLLIEDLERDRDNLPATELTVEANARCWLGVPLMVRGTAVGVISIRSSKPNIFSEAHQRLLVQVGNQLAIALDNARLFATAQNYAADLEKRVSERTEQLAREHRRTQTLLGIITELSTSLDMDLVLNRTLKVINETLGAEQGLIMLVSPDSSALYLRASLGYMNSVPKGGQISSLKPNEGLVGWVIVNRQPALIPDLWKDTRWIRQKDQTNVHRSALAVPLMIGEDTLGALLLYHRQPDHFSPDQLELAQATAKQIAVALNNAQLFRLIRDQAERLGDMLRQQHIETSRSQAILEAVADGVLVTDANRKITLFNASAEQILDLKREQVLGKSLEDFIGLFGKAAQSWVWTIHTWSEDPTIYTPGDIYAEQIELDNRKVVSVHLSPVRLRNDFLGTVSIFSNITHQVEVDRLKSEFVATVSHELRTPMTSIKGYVEVLLMGAAGKISEQQTHFLEIVKSNTERLAVLVNDLLDISRIEAGRVTLAFQALDLHVVANEAVANISRRMEEEKKPMHVKVTISAHLPRVWGDAERVRLILDNLLENAYQYTPENGHIQVTMHQLGDEVQVDVKDDGIGISPEEAPRVFERFYRGEHPLVLANSGTGLGLSIVHNLISMHNGRIWLESGGIPGQGSTFSFTLPVYKPGEAEP